MNDSNMPAPLDYGDYNYLASLVREIVEERAKRRKEYGYVQSVLEKIERKMENDF